MCSLRHSFRKRLSATVEYICLNIIPPLPLDKRDILTHKDNTLVCHIFEICLRYYTIISVTWCNCYKCYLARLLPFLSSLTFSVYDQRSQNQMRDHVIDVPTDFIIWNTKGHGWLSAIRRLCLAYTCQSYWQFVFSKLPLQPYQPTQLAFSIGYLTNRPILPTGLTNQPFKPNNLPNQPYQNAFSTNLTNKPSQPNLPTNLPD